MLNLKRQKQLLKKALIEFRAVNKTRNDLLKKVDRISDKVKNLECKKHFENGMTIKSIMSCNITKCNDEIYRSILKFIESKSGISKSGIHFETNQVYLSLMFDQTKPFEDQLSILEFVPYLKFSKGKKEIGIFEYTQNGSFGFEIHSSGEIKIVHAFHNDVIFTDLMEALKYVYDRHPYKLKEHEEYEC